MTLEMVIQKPKRMRTGKKPKLICTPRPSFGTTRKQQTRLTIHTNSRLMASATAVGTLNIEDCVIFGHNNEGVLVNLSAGANVNVRNSTFKNNGNGAAGTGVGAGMRATTSDGTFGVGHTVYVTVVNSSSDNNVEGFRMENNVRATMVDTTASNNSLNGFDVFPGAAASEINLESCIAANNKQWGVVSFTAGTIRISSVTVTNNSVQGLNPSGGAILTYNNNKVQGNGPGGATNGAPTGPAPQV